MMTFLKFTSSVGQTLHGTNFTKSKYMGCSLDDEDDWHHFRNGISSLFTTFDSNFLGYTTLDISLYIFYSDLYPKAVRATIRETPTSTVRYLQIQHIIKLAISHFTMLTFVP